MKKQTETFSDKTTNARTKRTMASALMSVKVHTGAHC